MIREALSFLPASHPAQWIRSFGDVGYESGLVDAFLHRREVSFCVDDCLDLLHESDLKLQRWYPNRSYYPDGCFPRNHPLYQAVSKLDETAIWRAGELFRSHPKHQFIACHKSRPESSYLIDFDSLDFMQYIPVKSDLTLVGLGSSLNHLNALDFLELSFSDIWTARTRSKYVSRHQDFEGTQRHWKKRFEPSSDICGGQTSSTLESHSRHTGGRIRFQQISTVLVRLGQ